MYLMYFGFTIVLGNALYRVLWSLFNIPYDLVMTCTVCLAAILLYRRNVVI